MAVINGIQNAFNAGELTPRLDGRTDSEVYFQGVREMTNFLTTPYGTAERPQGTRFLNSTKDNGEARFIPFQFSTEQTYSLEFGAGYIRFYKEDGQIQDSGSAYEIVTTFSWDEVEALTWTQSADVLYLYSGTQMIQQLTRTGHTSWTITDYEPLWGPFLDMNSDETLTLTPSNTTGSITITASSAVFNTGHVGSQWKIGEGYVEITGFADDTQVTADVKSDVVATATADWSEGAWSTYRGFPRCGTFHEGRLVSAGTNYDPRTFWASKSFIYDDYEVDTDTDSYAYSFECASSQVNQIVWLTSGDRLSIGTADGIWTAWAYQGGITATNIQCKEQHRKGAAAIQPVVIGAATYYVSADRRKIYEHRFYYDYNSYDAEDMTKFSEHITKGKIKSISIQQIPNSYISCVTDDGDLLVLLRDTFEKVTGWSRLETDGEFQSMCTIREEDNDRNWAIIERTIDGATKRYVEYFEDAYTPEDPDVCLIDCKEDLFYIHSGLTYNAPIDIEGATQANPVVITSTSHGLSDGDKIRINLTEGMEELNGEDYTVANVSTDTFELDGVDGSAFSVYTSGGEIRVYTETLTGLDHLEGKEVHILGDGDRHAPQIVSGGAITLDTAVIIAQVGLQYISRLETMRSDVGSFQGSAQGKTKKIVDIIPRFYRSLGFWYGNDEGLFEYESRQLNWDESPELYTGDLKLNMPSLLDLNARVIIEQRYAYPCNIVALMLPTTTS